MERIIGTGQLLQLTEIQYKRCCTCEKKRIEKKMKKKKNRLYMTYKMVNMRKKIDIFKKQPKPKQLLSPIATEETNQKSSEIHVIGGKHGKMSLSKSKLVGFSLASYSLFATT